MCTYGSRQNKTSQCSLRSTRKAEIVGGFSDHLEYLQSELEMGTKPNDKRVPPARLFLPCSHAGTTEVMPSRGHRGSPWPVIPFSCACKETQPNPSRNTALSDQINARRSWQRHRRPAFTNRNGSLEICQQGLFQQQLMGSPALPASCLKGLRGVGVSRHSQPCSNSSCCPRRDGRWAWEWGSPAIWDCATRKGKSGRKVGEKIGWAVRLEWWWREKGRGPPCRLRAQGLPWGALSEGPSEVPSRVATPGCFVQKPC